MSRLVIVESPGKINKIKSFLGNDYDVTASVGHIRDLNPHGLAVDVDNNYEPEYEISADKKDVVTKLRSLAKKARIIYLAQDKDREGEGIAFHVATVLGLDVRTASRITFNEITETAILNAIDNAGIIDMNKFYAQQARRIIDRLVGYDISPIVRQYTKEGKSAGRVQSVVLRLIVDKEKEVLNFNKEMFYKVSGTFINNNNNKSGGSCGNNSSSEINAELNDKLSSEDESREFLEVCYNSKFIVASKEKKQTTRSPPLPFITSTLQQEASSKLGMDASRTMSCAQKLYEGGKITYMRTDSTMLSDFALNEIKEEVIKRFGKEYHKYNPGGSHNSNKGKTQDAHEAIRVAHFHEDSVEGFSYDEKRLYKLIWKRTMASQMAAAKIDVETVIITIQNSEPVKVIKNRHFKASRNIIVFPGFLKVYRETTDNNDDNNDNDNNDNNDNEDPQVEVIGSHIFDKLKPGVELESKEICSAQSYTKHPPRYNDASLVKKLEDSGIGRPSTYASMIKVVQDRGYVEKKDKPGVEIELLSLTLRGDEITEETKKQKTDQEKGKLVPTDSGLAVNEFMTTNFAMIVDTKYTAGMETELDEIAAGTKVWYKVVDKYYKEFHPTILELRTNAPGFGKQLVPIGKHPKTDKDIYVYLSKNGPLIRMKMSDAELDTKSKKSKTKKETEIKDIFAEVPKNMSISGDNSITLDQAVSLLDARMSYPKLLGQHEGKNIVVHKGKFGPYIKYGTGTLKLTNYTDQELDALELEDVIEKFKEELKYPKTVGKYQDLDILLYKGQYGPYLSYNEKKYSVESEDIDEKKAIEVVEAKNKSILKDYSNGTQVLQGKYGPYIKAGGKNYKIPAGTEVNSLTLKQIKEIMGNTTPTTPYKPGAKNNYKKYNKKYTKKPKTT